METDKNMKTVIVVISTYNGALHIERQLDSIFEQNGVDATDMSSDDIKKANTGDKVYLVANIKMNDAIEDVTLEISI